MEKEFGKLTLAQLGAYIKHLPQIQEQQKEMGARFRELPSDRLDELISSGSWAEAYELDLSLHLACAAVAIGMGPMLAEIAKASDPQQALLDNLDVDLPDGHDPTFDESEVIGLVVSVGKTVASMATYGRSLSSLARAVREHGDQKALLDAVRIDRAAVACPSMARYIARAELVGDELFFGRLRNALRGPTKKRLQGHFNQLRYAFALLCELGVTQLSTAELVQLFVHDLGIYTDAPSAGKNLRAMYSKARKGATI